MRFWLTGVLLLAACDEDAPGVALAVKAFAGEDVIGAMVVCDGDHGDPRWTSICFDAEPSSFSAGWMAIPDYGDVAIDVGHPFIGFLPRLWFDLDDDGNLVAARGEIAYATDSADGTVTPSVRSGFVEVQDVSATERNRGRFELVLDDLTLSGTYDTGL